MILKHNILPYIDSAMIFAELAELPWSVFLDSGGRDSTVLNNEFLDNDSLHNRDKGFDVLAIHPASYLITEGEITHVYKNGQVSRSSDNPLKLLKQALPDKIQHDLPIPYIPGALGYFAYDLVRRFESIGPSIENDVKKTAKNDENLPEMAMGVYSVVVVVDHTNKCTYLIRYGENKEALDLWDFWLARLKKVDNKVELPVDENLVLDELTENMNQAEYSAKFDKVQHYIKEGDCYQVNLAKRFSGKAQGNAWQSYLQLRKLSPAPYAAYLNYPFATILSNSPESFISCRNGKVITSPIKGTRARNHKDKRQDAKIAQELLKSKKDRAENLMIVDLMRNDLGKCCKPGSVKVPSLFAVHSFANVHHLISTIVGELSEGAHAIDLLRHCFPGGSITGAPKLRAMQIIEELEPHQRGLYCGSIGYIGFDGNMETNIAIRTITIKEGVARYSAGGGLIADSDKKEEYQEIIDKAKMMSQVLVGNK